MERVQQIARVTWSLMLGLACGGTISGVLLQDVHLLYGALLFYIATTLGVLVLPSGKEDSHGQ